MTLSSNMNKNRSSQYDRCSTIISSRQKKMGAQHLVRMSLLVVYVAVTTMMTTISSTTKTYQQILPTIDAFQVPTTTTTTSRNLFTKIPSKEIIPLSQQRFFSTNHRQQFASVSSTSTSSSTLFMGVMEDFITGQDDDRRDKDNTNYLQSLQTRVKKVNELESMIEELDDDELQMKTNEFKQRLQNKKEDLYGPIVEEAFAVVREAAWRVLELRHYDVQIMGGMILHDGRLAEMATGEGKTLVSSLPVYLNACTGRTSFVVTVNDYLARRDMEKMGQIHKFLGLTVGLIQANMTPEQRRIAYQSDVVYVTNAELGFDYLRDHLALSPEQTVLLQSNRETIAMTTTEQSTTGGSSVLDGCFCVVDEADSVLIDEARTPLIISEQVPAPANKYSVANQLANALKDTVHYKVDLKNKNVVMTEVGYRDCERALAVDSLFNLVNGEAWAPFIMNAIKAKELFNKDIEYTVLTDTKTGQPNGVGIIDAFTGRVLDGRRWSDGLHQSIEAMEGIAVSQQSKVIAKVTYQALFRQLFQKRLSGMTGTAMADAKELDNVYGLKVTTVPTALPVARRDYPDVAFKTRKAANVALIKEIMNVGGGTPDGRPCLIGTTSVAQSEMIVELLKKEANIQAELLNASPKNAPREAEIVAQAGRAGVVTVATNMAGRGTDILLGGCPTTMSRIKTRSVLVEQGVVNSNSKDSTKVFPPPPPEDYFPSELDDDIYYMLKDAASAIRSARKADQQLTESELDEILTIAFDTTEADDDPEYIVKLRNAAAAVKDVYAEVLAEEKAIVQKLGGLYVMGTNRHESSRIDQQLRGRAGRQGDPGSSRFFLSFEDDMFVIFGGDKLQSILKTFRVSDDMPIEAQSVTNALNKVQAQVEEKYRSIRTEIFRFDEVLNSQRNVIYSRRTNILFQNPQESYELLQQYNRETVREIVVAQTDNSGVTNVVKVIEKMGQYFPPIPQIVTEADLLGSNAEAIITYLTVAVDEILQEQSKELDQRNQKAGVVGRTTNYLTLVTMDNAWSTHLQATENLKEAVVLRSYQGRDPVSEYEREAFLLFQGLDDTMRRNAVYSLWQNLAQQLTSKQPQSA